MTDLSTLYNIKSRGNIHGKAKEGFIRPTIGQYFTSKNFEEVLSYIEPAIGDTKGGGYYTGTLNGYELISAPIAGQSQHTNRGNAANFCTGLTIGGFNDWYLPTKDELDLLYQNHTALESAGAGSFIDDWYWSSTEASSSSWRQNFIDGSVGSYDRDGNLYIRAIRSIPIV
jgi:hypothetical protein